MIWRYDLYVDDPWIVFEWLEENVKPALVRKIAYEVTHKKQWFMKIVLDDEQAAKQFHNTWGGTLQKLS
jgi:hypothetical protein